MRQCRMPSSFEDREHEFFQEGQLQGDIGASCSRLPPYSLKLFHCHCHFQGFHFRVFQEHAHHDRIIFHIFLKDYPFFISHTNETLSVISISSGAKSIEVLSYI